MAETKTVALAAGMLILLALVGTTYYLANVDTTYYCEKANTVSMCFKLSNPTNGISSRCYYNETIPTKYFTCTSGWKPIKNFPNIMNNLTITGKEIIDTSSDKLITSDMSNFIKEDFNSKYGVITLTSSKTGKLAEYSLTSTKEDIIDLEMIGKATLYEDGTLFDDTNFKNKAGNLINLKSQYFILVTKDNYVDIPDTYKEKCDIHLADINGSKEWKNCYNVTATTKKVNQPISTWEEYNKQILIAGDYDWRFLGKREIGQIVDVLPVKSEKPFEEWVWFNSSWVYRKDVTITGTTVKLNDIPVLLNVTYIAGSMQNTWNDIRFVNGTCSGEQTSVLLQEKNSNNSNSALYWVLIPTLNAGASNTTACMYYNNPTATTGDNKVSLWKTANAQIVYHAEEGTGGTLYSSTGVGNITFASGSSWGGTAIGDIGEYAFNFGPNSYSTVESFIMNKSFWSQFVVTNTASDTLAYISHQGSDNGLSWRGDGGKQIETWSANALRSDVFVYQSGKVRAFGAMSNATNGMYANWTATDLKDYTYMPPNFAGEFYLNQPTFPLVGNISELQVYNETKSFDWMAVMSRNSALNDFYAFGPQQDNGITMKGKVLTSEGIEVNNAIVLILNSTGTKIANTTSNVTGDWNIFILDVITNFTVVGYNPNNISQGGNAYPFITA